jgi:ubiquinone/menaquinone biosynthesis C-methylase UbiE
MPNLKHNRRIRDQFSKQAAHFGAAGLTLSSQHILGWIVAGLPLQVNHNVLDVAAGTGHLSRAIAPFVKSVTAVDITLEMIEVARVETARCNFDNILIEQGNAGSLSYEDNTFDMVLSRLAIHHFEQPIVQLNEMVRVCKPGHIVGIIDLLSPEDQHVAARYNHLERLRDPSHTFAQSKPQMKALLEDAGLTVHGFSIRDIQVDFYSWVQMAGTDLKTVTLLKNKLIADLEGETNTGMRPFIEGGQLKFLQVWSIALGIKRTPR